MLEDKAQALAINEDLIDKLHTLLKRLRIPKNQFHEIEKEIGDI